MIKENYDSNLENVRGTLAVEGMSISDETLANIKRLAKGEISCSAIVDELKIKYMQRA